MRGILGEVEDRRTEIQLLHLYPQLMGLYGEWGNLALLRRNLEDRGFLVTVTHDPQALSTADFVFMGAGTERSQRAVLEDLRQHGSALAQAVEREVPMLFTGTAMDLLGSVITDAAGTEYAGLGLWGFTAQESDKRIVGDVLGASTLTEQPVVGFMNKCCLIRGIKSPFLTGCELGFGNESQGGAEGLWSRHVLGTHLTGPLLVKNPALAKFFVDLICVCAEAQPLLEAKTHLFQDRGYQVTVSELRKLAEKEEKSRR